VIASGGVAMRQFLIGAIALALAGCSTTGQLGNLSDPTPEKPGTRITIRNPNVQKWVAARQTGQPKPTNVSIWVCRPLACASGNAMVGTEIGNSPTRHPDRKALEKAANLLAVQTRSQDMMMEAASEGDDRIAPLSSKVTDIRGYPAIIAESKRTSRGKASFIVRGELFIGLARVRLVAASSDRADAKRYFDEFVTAMEIVDVEPPQPGATPEPAPPAALDRTQERM
jgi:hypothetical protein